MLATTIAIAILGTVLSGSTVTVPNERGVKGDLRLASSACFDGCDKGAERLVQFNTDVVVDEANGIVTLIRDRVGD